MNAKEIRLGSLHKKIIVILEKQFHLAVKKNLF